MTDRELLELAAKAAGICGSWLEIDKEFKLDSPIKVDGVNRYLWRPHQDDGDSFRLACDLGLDVLQDERTVSVNKWDKGKTLSKHLDQENIDDCRYTATRKVILRAAAEIGKSMEKSQ